MNNRAMQADSPSFAETVSHPVKKGLISEAEPFTRDRLIISMLLLGFADK